MLNLVANTTRPLIANLARRTPPFRGKTRLLRASDRVLRGLGQECVEQTIGGVRYALATEDLIDFSLLYEGGYQSKLAAYLASRLAPHSVFWDVGTNVGAVSLPVAAAVPTAEVHSFEPSPTVHARFLRNLQLNPDLLSRVHPHRRALSDRNGEAEFYESSEQFNSGVGGMGIAGNRTQKGVLVPVARGDALVSDGSVPAPQLIKIDVEGFEGEVLRGLENFLRTDVKLELVFEHSPYRFRERRLAIDVHCEFLRSLGFELLLLDQSSGSVARPRPLADADLERDCDVVARRL